MEGSVMKPIAEVLDDMNWPAKLRDLKRRVEIKPDKQPSQNPFLPSQDSEAA
jgi:hypothetical protein